MSFFGPSRASCKVALWTIVYKNILKYTIIYWNVPIQHNVVTIYYNALEYIASEGRCSAWPGSLCGNAARPAAVAKDKMYDNLV